MRTSKMVNFSKLCLLLLVTYIGNRNSSPICKQHVQNLLLDGQHIHETMPKETPPSWWWIVVSAISALSQQVNIAIVKLQSKDLLVSQQTAILQDLGSVLCTQIDVEGPFPESHITIIDKDYNSTYGSWSVSHNNVNQYLLDQGMFIQESLTMLGYDASHDIVNIIGHYIVYIIDGIIKIQAECTSTNGPEELYTIPPVLPHQLVQLCGAAFTAIIVKHLPQLKHSWGMNQIADLETEFRELCLKYQSNPVFTKAIDACDSNTSFQQAWSIVEGQFDVIRNFCGGIATVFANTATVESDFSILGWEKDEYRMSLTDLSLEGILQCKQHDLLNSLA